MKIQHIPKTFELARILWNTKEIHKAYDNKGMGYSLAFCSNTTNTIELAKYVDDINYDKSGNEFITDILVPPNRKNKVFYHELVHAILFTMEHDLNNDESFVQCFGNLLYEYMETRK